jgi:hypothetical protein
MKYIEFINAVFVPSLNPTSSQISSEVKSICNTVFLAIQTCSDAFLSLDITYGFFYNFSSIYDIILNYVATSPSFSGWIGYILGNNTYKTCVTVAAANWKSVMIAALLGLKYDTDENMLSYLKQLPELKDQDDQSLNDLILKFKEIEQNIKNNTCLTSSPD